MSDGAAPPPGGEATAPGPTKPGPVQRILDLVNTQFANIFSETHWPYTVIFFVCAMFIAMLRFFPGPVTLLVGIFITVTLAISFGFMFAFSNIPRLATPITTGRPRRKVAMFGIFTGVATGTTVILFAAGEQLPPQYRPSLVLPVLFSIVFFAWNLIQIFFIARGLYAVSFKAEAAAFKGIDATGVKESKGRLVLVLAVVAPFAGLGGLVAAFLSGAVTSMNALVANPVGQLVFVAWLAAMILVIAVASLHATATFNATVKHETPSVVAPVVHLLFFTYILFRSYGFMNALSKALTSTEISFVDNLTDAAILVLTLLLLFKSLGSKLGKSSVFTKTNLPFITYAFVIVVVMGTMSLQLGITSGPVTIQLPQAWVNAINNLGMMAVAIVYYFLHVRHKLAQEGYLERDAYSAHEVEVLIDEFARQLATRHGLDPGAAAATAAAFMDGKGFQARTAGIPATPGEAPGATPARHAPPPAPAAPPAAGRDEEKEGREEREEPPVGSKYPAILPRKIDGGDDR